MINFDLIIIKLSIKLIDFIYAKINVNFLILFIFNKYYLNIKDKFNNILFFN